MVQLVSWCPRAGLFQKTPEARVGGSDLRLGSSTAVPVDAGTLLLTCEAASKTVCGGRSISSLNGDLGRMVVFFDPLLRLMRAPAPRQTFASRVRGQNISGVEGIFLVGWATGLQRLRNGCGAPAKE